MLSNNVGTAAVINFFQTSQYSHQLPLIIQPSLTNHPQPDLWSHRQDRNYATHRQRNRIFQKHCPRNHKLSIPHLHKNLQPNPKWIPPEDNQKRLNPQKYHHQFLQHHIQVHRNVWIQRRTKNWHPNHQHWKKNHHQHRNLCKIFQIMEQQTLRRPNTAQLQNPLHWLPERI